MGKPELDELYSRDNKVRLKVNSAKLERRFARNYTFEVVSYY